MSANQGSDQSYWFNWILIVSTMNSVPLNHRAGEFTHRRPRERLKIFLKKYQHMFFWLSCQKYLKSHNVTDEMQDGQSDCMRCPKCWVKQERSSCCCVVKEKRAGRGWGTSAKPKKKIVFFQVGRVALSHGPQAPSLPLSWFPAVSCVTFKFVAFSV